MICFLLIHPSIFLCLSGVGLRWQLNVFQLIVEDPEAFPGQLGDVIPPASSPGLHLVKTASADSFPFLLVSKTKYTISKITSVLWVQVPLPQHLLLWTDIAFWSRSFYMDSVFNTLWQRAALRVTCRFLSSCMSQSPFFHLMIGPQPSRLVSARLWWTHAPATLGRTLFSGNSTKEMATSIGFDAEPELPKVTDMHLFGQTHNVRARTCLYFSGYGKNYENITLHVI